MSELYARAASERDIVSGNAGRHDSRERRDIRPGFEVRPVVIELEAENDFLPTGIVANESAPHPAACVALAQNCPGRNRCFILQRRDLQHVGNDGLGRLREVDARHPDADLSARIYARP